jgi:BON domain-containing protein
MFRRLAAVLVLGLASISVAASGAPSGDQQTTEAIHKALERLPYYGVFDSLAFRYDRGTVTLSGFAYALGLNDDAMRAVKRVSGVDDVVNEIVELPVSQQDDRIRWATFFKIYNDAFLSRYAPGGGAPVGFDRRFLLARTPGMQPFGDYPIHIVVRNGRTLLVGTVDFESDKIAAGVRAREVPGTFGVENELVVPDRGTR